MSAGAITKQPQRVMGVIPGIDIEKVVKEIKTSTQEKANEKSENKLKSEIRDKFLTEFLLKAGFEKDEIKAIKKGMAKSQEQVENPFSAKIENADSKKKAEAIMDFILGTACNLLNGLSYGLTGIGWNGYQTIRMFSKLNREAKQARLEEVSKYFEEELAPIKGQIEAQLKADQSMLLAEYKKYKNEKNMSKTVDITT